MAWREPSLNVVGYTPPPSVVSTASLRYIVDARKAGSPKEDVSEDLNRFHIIICREKISFVNGRINISFHLLSKGSKTASRTFIISFSSSPRSSTPNPSAAIGAVLTIGILQAYTRDRGW